MDRDVAVPDVESLPGEAARAWIDRHHGVAAPGEYDHDFVWDITADADGPFCRDVDGNIFLDFTSHMGAAPLGYNDPRLLSKLRSVDLVDPIKIAGQDFYHAAGPDPERAELPTATQLMERLVKRSDHYGLDTVFLSNSGAEAVENAIKISHTARPASANAVTFEGAFHGRTIGALSITRAGVVYTRGYPSVRGVQTVPFCRDRHCGGDGCHCGFFTDRGSQLRALMEPEGFLDPSEISYVIIEPIQGVGGYRMPSDDFMREVQSVTETHGIPLIVDEIQTGIGRTGRMWASDHYPIEPDGIASAKALRVGATIASGDLFPAEPNRLGSTWGAGDLVSSMVGCFTLDVIESESLMANATARGEQCLDLLRDADLSGVEDVRGLGLLLAVEFDSSRRRDRVVAELVSRGLLVTGCGERTVRLLPPLTVTEREIELGAELFAEGARGAA
jgi:4-aminobutyrate aminotransferase